MSGGRTFRPTNSSKTTEGLRQILSSRITYSMISWLCEATSSKPSLVSGQETVYVLISPWDIMYSRRNDRSPRSSSIDAQRMPAVLKKLTNSSQAPMNLLGSMFS